MWRVFLVAPLGLGRRAWAGRREEGRPGCRNHRRWVSWTFSEGRHRLVSRDVVGRDKVGCMVRTLSVASANTAIGVKAMPPASRAAVNGAARCF